MRIIVVLPEELQLGCTRKKTKKNKRDLGTQPGIREVQAVCMYALYFMYARGEGGGGGAARLSLLVILSRFSRPRAGLTTRYR